MIKIFPVLLFLILQQPLFSQSRVKENINSNWLFYKGEVKPSPEFDQSWETIDLPHTWNALDMLDDEPGYYRGTAWYRKEFNLSPQLQDKQLWIYFEGANQDAQIFLNDQLVGEHPGGYTAFNFNITSYLRDGKNLLEVKLSNSHNPDVPPVGGDLGHFGGIYRNVHLLGVNEICFDPGYYASPGILVSIPKITSSSAEIQIKARLNSSQNKTVEIEHELLDPEGRSVFMNSSDHNTREGSYFLEEEIIKINEDIKRWSPLSPVLYTLVSRIKAKDSGILLDEVKNQIGFRSIEISGKQDLVLNGSPLFIKGIGKHQDFYRMGYAVPDDILEEDIRLLKETGANLVRSHYPLSPSTYNICDQIGVLVWAKIPIMDKITHSEAFTRNSKNMMLELIYQNYNRPSFILWGYACEIFGDMDWYWPKPQDPKEVKLNLEKTREFSEEFEEFVRKTDPYRLTGNDFHTDPTPEYYSQTDLTDINRINGWNIYQGWYHNNLDSIGWALKEFYSWNPDLPFVIAEFGAGSDPRIHTYRPTIFDFSIEYQNLFHEQYLAAARRYYFLDGMSVWTLVDFQVDNRADAVPHINSKGLLTSARKKKDAFYLYKASWNKNDPFVHLTAKDWNHRIEVQSEMHRLIPVTVYSNLNEIELFHNGNSMGVRKTEFPGKAVWMINLESGENILDAKAENNGQVYEDHGRIMVETIAKKDGHITLPSDEICINVGQSRTYFTDALLHDYWTPDRKYGADGFGHLSGSYYTTWTNMPAWEGIREGTGHDIYRTDIDPVFQTFLVGVEEYRVDLEPGEYKVDLYFAEPFRKTTRMDSLENTGADPEGNRVFDVFINGKKYIEGLNLAEGYGDYMAVIKSFSIAIEDKGLIITLNGIKGDPVLNGIKIRRI